MTKSGELNIKGTRLSGRVWKGSSKPVRSIISKNVKRLSRDKIRDKWLKSKLFKEEMNEIKKEAKELVEKSKEEKKKKAKEIKIKRQKKIENEIRSAGKNLIVIGQKKFSKMSKKARKGLTKLTPEMIAILKSNKRL
ncbi:hypothetical protein TpMuguga_02g00932 [Theileria parva strain Muguga]|uniref:uncharacterized protein n=1 Tax=Theileria parva strain Muguga TaxID=333668 RepID=UPI001C6223B4|nr:uncharacterized protein TpMuguga_02g00932 [Theileria parva strain Muguga]EAN33217.2 hypothetical protein TpMuguga_02g00932 [Theileria parva strain Muguga]